MKNSIHDITSYCVALITAMAFIASGCNEQEQGEEPSATDVEASEQALEIEGDLPEEDIEGEMAISGYASALLASVLPEPVLELLGIDAEAGDDPCYTWGREGTTVTVDFAACEDIDGTVSVTVAIGEPAVVTFGDEFVINGKDVDGSILLDRESFNPFTYSVSSDESILVLDTETEVTSELTFEGTLVIDRREGYATLVGQGVVATSGGDEGDTETSFYLGGTSADTVGDAPLTWMLPMEDCYCPTSGAMALESSYVINTVTIEIGGEYLGEDYTYDLEVDIDDVEIQGTLTIELTGECGAFEACFTTTASSTGVTVTRAQVQAAADELWPDGVPRSVQAIIDGLPEEYSVEIPTEELCGAADISQQSIFSGGLCSLPVDETEDGEESETE